MRQRARQARAGQQDGLAASRMDETAILSARCRPAQAVPVSSAERTDDLDAPGEQPEEPVGLRRTRSSGPACDDVDTRTPTASDGASATLALIRPLGHRRSPSRRAASTATRTGGARAASEEAAPRPILKRRGGASCLRGERGLRSPRPSRGVRLRQLESLGRKEAADPAWSISEQLGDEDVRRS